MSQFSPTPFRCPACGAMYKVVRIETAPVPDTDLACRACGAKLPSRDGDFMLKYFLVESARRRVPMRSGVARRG